MVTFWFSFEESWCLSSPSFPWKALFVWAWPTSSIGCFLAVRTQTRCKAKKQKSFQLALQPAPSEPQVPLNHPQRALANVPWTPWLCGSFQQHLPLVGFCFFEAQPHDWEHKQGDLVGSILANVGLLVCSCQPAQTRQIFLPLCLCGHSCPGLPRGL